MEPIDWLVDKILPVGLSILGAPSKYYKSYMALDMELKGRIREALIKMILGFDIEDMNLEPEE